LHSDPLLCSKESEETFWYGSIVAKANHQQISQLFKFCYSSLGHKMDNIKPRQRVWITEPTDSSIGWILENDPENHKALVEYKDHNNVKHTAMIAHEHLSPFGY
jgi:hypothetical protein